MGKKEYKSAIRSRRLINEALAEIMNEKAMEKITVTDVVKRADLNRGTFYAHYRDINDVLEKQIVFLCSELRTVLHERSLNSKSPDPYIVLKQIQKSLERNLPFFTSLIKSGNYTNLSIQLRQVFIDYMLEHEKEFSNNNHEDYLFNIMFASGGISAMYQDWFNGKLPITLDQLTKKATIVAREIANKMNH